MQVVEWHGREATLTNMVLDIFQQETEWNMSDGTRYMVCDDVITLRIHYSSAATEGLQ